MNASIAENLAQVHAQIQAACQAAGRPESSVRLLAVSKTWGADAVRAAHAAGQTAFGENYIQEAVDKITALHDLPLEWHCIGPIQSNKTRLVAEHFDWVHSIDRLKIAERLSSQRGEFPDLGELQVCVQINVSKEESKSGIALEEVEALCNAIAKFPHLVLRGLMAIPAPSDDVIEQRQAFAAVRECFVGIKAKHSNDVGYDFFDTLSMGMSDDMEAAIAEGSTMVRIGSAIFGKRDKIKV